MIDFINEKSKGRVKKLSTKIGTNKRKIINLTLNKEE